MNLLGLREREIYGDNTLSDLNDNLRQIAKKSYVSLEIFQSNSEGALVDFIQSCLNYDGIVINAGGYTHTSVAIRDALLSIHVPYMEVHMSNVYARESFRKTSYLSDKAMGVIAGFGEHSYYYALEYIINKVAVDG